MAAQEPVEGTGEQPRSSFQNHMFREIYKNTWLRRIVPTSSKKKERFWVVFCVHDDCHAFLEAYVDNKLAVYHKPVWHISLNQMQHISPTIWAEDKEFAFVLTLTSEVVRLFAPTWEEMLDWVDNLWERLNELKIVSPKENLYTKLPDRSGPLLPTRDPTSPLPPPPEVPPEVLPGTEISRPRSGSNSEARRPGVFNFDNLTDVLASSSSSSTHYEFLCQQETAGPSNRPVERSVSCSPRILQAAPQPYKTLREQQVMKLQKEMAHRGGVRIQLRRKDCLNSIGLVDAFEAVYVVGWKQKDYPILYSALHIGDQLLNIDGIAIKTASEAQKILSSHCTGLYVNLTFNRIPHGQVFLIQKESEGQSLGIVLDNNTAVIESVQPDCLAARHGLTLKAPTLDGITLTNWVLTEINGRPLNLFFIKNQVRDRLNALGKDISILVQPLDLITKLKKQMKSIRNYKDYILQ